MANSAVVGVLRALLVADTAQFDSALKRSTDQFKTLSKEFSRVGSQMTGLGQTLSASVTAPLLAIGAGASKLAIDFESSFAGVRKTVTATDAEFSLMSQQFRELAKTIPVNVNDINRLAESAGALGIPQEKILKFTEVMSGLGTATNLTADEAATAIAQIQNIFGAAGKDTDRFASTLVALGNNGASTEKQIVEMASRIAGAGHNIGLTQTQVLGFSSSLASVGISAEAGGSAMSRMLLKMNDAVAKGGASLNGFAKVAGVNAAAFKQAFEHDAAGAVTMFIEGLQRVKTEGGNLSATLEPLIGKNIVLKDTMLRLAGAGALVAKDQRLAADAFEKNNALQNETAKRYETTAAQLTILWNKIKDVGITIGNSLLPVIKALSDAVSGALPYIEALVKAFTSLPPGVQLAIIAFGGIVAAIGPVLMALGAMSTGLGSLVGAFSKTGIATKLLGGTFAWLAANPVVAIIAALGLLGIAIYAAATAETEQEKAIRTNAKAYNEQLTSMNNAITVYEALRKKQNLTTDETKQLETATRILAGASGQTVEAFQKQSDKALELAKSMRDVKTETQKVAIEQAKVQKRSLEATIGQAIQQREQVGAGKGVKYVGRESMPVPFSPEETANALVKIDASLATYRAELEKTRVELGVLTGSTDEAAAVNARHAASYGIKTAAQTASTAATTSANAATEDEETKLTAAEKAAKRHKEQIQELANEMSGVNLTKKVRDLTDAVELNRKTMGDAALGTKALVEEVKQLIDAGAALSPVLQQVADMHVHVAVNTVKLKGTVADLLADIPSATRQLREYNAAVTGDITTMPVQRKIGTGDLLKGLPNLAPQFKAFTEKNLKSPWLSEMGSDFASSVPGALMSGFSAAKNKTGDAGKQMGAQLGGTLASSAAKSVTPMITKAIGGGMGKAIGGLVGNAVPIVGPIIGAVVGGLVDKAFSHKGRDATVAFADSMGGFDELHKKLGTLGAEGEKMWVQLTGVGKRDEKGAQKIIEDIQKKLTAADEKAAETARLAAERLQKLNDSFGKLQSSLQVFGGVAPASLRPMIEELQKSTGLTAEMKAALTGMSQDPSWQTMQEKAQGLGIDLAALGPKFQESKLTDIALGYARDLTMFADAGADMTGVVLGMADELSTLYVDAMKNGVALPKSLEPYMKKLVEMGKLVDENGDKVTDLNTVAFKDIEDKSLTDVVNVLKDIKDLLADALPKAAADGAAKIQDTFAQHPVTIPVVYGTPGNVPTPGAAEVPPPQIGLQGGTHGQFVDWGAGTPVMLHGREAVVPYGHGLSGGAVNITVVSQLDGREVARNQVRYIPNELRAAGV